MNHLITFSHAYLLILLAWNPVYAENTNNSMSADQSTQSESDRVKNANAAQTSKTMANRMLDLLTEEMEDQDIEWLEVNGEKFLALWQADKTGNPFGAVLILHGEGQSVDTPYEINAIRNNLSHHGWATLAINLPPVAQSTVPPRPAPKAETENNSKQTKQPSDKMSLTTMSSHSKANPENESDGRIAAAIAFLKAQGQYNIVIVGHGLGATRTMKFIDDLSSDQKSPGMRSGKIQRPIRAVVLVSARNQIPLSDKALPHFFNDPNLPVLDLYYGEHFLDEVETLQRAKAARAKGILNYYQLKVLRPTSTDATSENRLTRRVRGFLNKHAKGVEIERK